MAGMGKMIALATATAGTLDLLSAFVFGGMAGRTPVQVLQGVATGPFGDGMRQGGAGAAAAGLLTHYAIMTVMVSVFVLAARRIGWLTARPVVAGLAYGLLLYLVMYWGVLPARYPAVFPKTGAWDVGNALFLHLICVGLPIALITARHARGWAVR